MRVFVLGAGGHGKVVADVVTAAGHEVIGFVDADPERVGEVVESASVSIVLSQASFLAELADVEADALALAVGDNDVRLRLFRELDGRIAMPTFVHPSAQISPSAVVGAGTVVMPRVVVNAAATVGVAVILNTACIVEHDCVVGDGVHVSPNATLSGTVSVGERTWVGAGATIIQGLTVGDDAKIGAGAVVIHDIDAGTTNVGVPTRAVKTGNH